jgi:hypothetical protein
MRPCEYGLLACLLPCVACVCRDYGDKDPQSSTGAPMRTLSIIESAASTLPPPIAEQSKDSHAASSAPPSLRRRSSVLNGNESGTNVQVRQERICDQCACVEGSLTEQFDAIMDVLPHERWLLDSDCDLILCFQCARQPQHQGHQLSVLALPQSMTSSLFRIANHDKPVRVWTHFCPIRISRATGVGLQ